MIKKIKILGVRVDDISFSKAVEEVVRLAHSKKRGNYVVTINAEFVMLARRNAKFASILAGSNLSLADGWWVAFSKLILGGKSHARVAGVNLVEKVCEKCANQPIRIGFLGGFGGVATTVAKRQVSLNPGLKVVLAEAGNPTMGYELRLKKAVNRLGGIDILFVAYGMGKQEFFIDRIREKLNVGVLIGVGGAFDYLSGTKKRAPQAWQNLGLEWLWRLISEPRRVWRMRVLPVFLVLVFWQFFKSRVLSSSK